MIAPTKSETRTTPIVVTATPAVRQAATQIAFDAGLLHSPSQESLWERWFDIPVTSPSTFSKLDLKSITSDVALVVYSSGGSTGSPTFSLFTMEEALANAALHGRGYTRCGITSHDVVATWGAPGLLSAEFAVPMGLGETRCKILPIGADSTSQAKYEVIKDLGATVLLVMPSDLIPFERWLEQRNLCLPGIRMIVTGGEPLTSGHRSRLLRLMQPQVKFTSVLQAVESGTIGYQCQSSGASEYHVHQDHRLVEIVNPDQNGKGNLVVTNTTRKLVPSVRCTTGDMASLQPDPCTCGDPAPRIVLHGRAHNQGTLIGGEVVDLSELLALESKYAIPPDDFLIEVSLDEDARDVVTIYSDALVKIADSLVRATELFRTLHPKFEARMETGVIPLVSIEPRKHELDLTAGGKVRKIIDRREP